MNSIKLVSFLLASLLTSVTLAATSDNARDCLPACDSAQIAIFNGASFDGMVYLHETDVQLSARQTAAVRAIALQGTPAICQDAGTIIVTLASR
jgi:hypothetical protein